MQLELVANKNPKEIDAWNEGPVPAENSIRGFYGVTVTEADHARTTSLLTDTMGFRQVAREDDRIRFEVGAGGPSSIIDVLHAPDAPRGIVSVGTVHHVAWRAPNDEQQVKWREKLVGAGLHVTPIIDRKYFHSIYFREPGGVLFEIATDPPGFTVDEPPDSLGLQLRLPPWLESARHEIEQSLPPVRVPTLAKAR